MLEQIYFSLPLWVWLIVICIIVFSCYHTTCSVKTNEKFTDKIKVYNFNTSWCGYSQRFQPEWDKFSERVKSDSKLSHVTALDIKCDDDSNKSMCENYQVPGYPFVVIENGNEHTNYDGERTADAIISNILNK
jgi:thiol-disulfide isomerase/thioredoxin